MKTRYINYRGGAGVETVDSVTDAEGGRREVARLIKEYRLSDPSGDYWVSGRSTSGWRKSEKGAAQ